ncbi:hypothetical protein MBLNU459_g2769t1 [Dothideomycetes sp. NU459]
MCPASEDRLFACEADGVRQAPFLTIPFPGFLLVIDCDERSCGDKQLLARAPSPIQFRIAAVGIAARETGSASTRAELLEPNCWSRTAGAEPIDRQREQQHNSMRTSRISRDTAHAAGALSKRVSARRSIRTFARALDTAPASGQDENTDPAAPASDSDLSSPPSSPSEASEYSDQDASPPPTAAPSLKRKRPQTTSVKPEPVSPNVRQSLRKAPSVKKARRRPAKRIKGENGHVTTEPPANWEQVYALTAEMRKRVLAPVDTMGCESLAEDHRPPLERRLQTLVALMLSSQTKDTVTFAAMRNLQENLDGGFTLASLLAVEPARLNELIAKVGFHNNKTKYIKATAEILRDRFGGDIPDTIEGMVSLPGVGPKMAYLCMSAAWGRDEGIGVDVHVHRITNLWGWHKTQTPEQTRAELESWLPKEKWHDINHLLVGFGQMICLPVGRKCGECTLADNGLCPSAVVPKQVTKRVKKEVIKAEDGAVKVEREVDEEVDVKLEKADEHAPPLDAPQAGVQIKSEIDDIEDIGAGRRRSSRRA